MNYLTQLLQLSNQSKYTTWYYNIISRAITRATTKKEAVILLDTVEKHHILPKSFKMGGNKDTDNLAFLTPREHFIVHKLLMKMFDDPLLTRKMRYGFVCFTMNKTGNRIIRAIDYAKAKAEMKELNKMKRLWCIGRVSPFKGKTHTTESKKMNAEKHSGKPSGKKGFVTTQEIKEKISLANTGHPYYPQTEESRIASSSRSYTSGFNKIHSGTMWINDGTNNKRIKPEQLENYPGFVAGRLVPVRSHISQS